MLIKLSVSLKEAFCVNVISRRKVSVIFIVCCYIFMRSYRKSAQTYSALMIEGLSLKRSSQTWQLNQKFMHYNLLLLGENTKQRT